jgi:hypothetical protein
MTIRLRSAILIGGQNVAPPSTLTLSDGLEADLVSRGAAEYVFGLPSVFEKQELRSDAWYSAPSIFRLRLVGSGTLTIDSRNSLGEFSGAVETYSASDATDQIEFPFLGAGAVEMRLRFPTTLSVEII